MTHQRRQQALRVLARHARRQGPRRDFAPLQTRSPPPHDAVQLADIARPVVRRSIICVDGGRGQVQFRAARVPLHKMIRDQAVSRCADPRKHVPFVIWSRFGIQEPPLWSESFSALHPPPRGLVGLAFRSAPFVHNSRPVPMRNHSIVPSVSPVETRTLRTRPRHRMPPGRCRIWPALHDRLARALIPHAYCTTSAVPTPRRRLSRWRPISFSGFGRMHRPSPAAFAATI